MIKRVLQHFFKQKNVILLLILSIIVFFISIISPYLNSVFIDSLVFNSLNFKEIIIISIFIMFLNILGIVLTFFTSLLNVKIYNFTNFSILKEVFNNIYICKIEFLNKFDSSYLTQRVISDINIITNYVINTVKDIMFNFCILAFIIFTFLKIDRWLVIFIIFLIIPYSILYIKLKKPLQNAYKQKKENIMEYKPPKVGQMNGEKKGINDVVWQTQFIAADVFLFVIIGITVSQVDFTLKDIPSDIEE